MIGSVILAIGLVAAPSGALGDLVAGVPPESLALRLRIAETSSPGAREGARAALLLGRLHYARGEYRSASAAFSRAAARLDPARKGEALYWAGLSWLALRAPNQARAALEEVADSQGPWRAEARLAIANAWELLDRPDRAYETLEQLLSSDPGEAGPPALERYAALADRFDRSDVARRARARLLADYPASMEAAAATASLVARAGDDRTHGPFQLELGAFAAQARARSLASRAVEAGFVDARVSSRGERVAPTYVVILGAYANEIEARKALARAVERLGVEPRLARAQP